MAYSSSYRWWILWLLFFATTINYLDRIVFSVLVPIIRNDLHLDDRAYGWVTGAFQIAYTLGFVFAGRLIDRFGTRIGYGAATLFWSIAAGLHAVARTPFDLGFWRAMLGLGESGNFPAAIKAVAEWFPPQERAFATGIFNAGTTVASIIGPPALVWMSSIYGWRSAFVFTAALGALWLVMWWPTYKSPAIDRTQPPEPQVGWGEAFRHRETWGFALGKFFSDPVWWFYLFWLPLYLYDVRKFDMKQVSWVLPVMYSMSAVGSVAGGWMSGMLLRQGWAPGRARKTAMALCAGLMPVAALGVVVPSPTLAVFLFGLALAGHQGWSANLYTTTSDVFPKNAVASVIGIGGAAGGVAGVLFSAVIPGYVIPVIGDRPVFLGMGFFYVIAWIAVHHFMGDLTRIKASEYPNPAVAPSNR